MAKAGDAAVQKQSSVSIVVSQPTIGLPLLKSLNLGQMLRGAIF